MQEKHYYELNVVYRVGEDLKTVLLQYATEDEAQKVLEQYHIGAEAKIDDDTTGIIHDVWIMEHIERRLKPRK